MKNLNRYIKDRTGEKVEMLVTSVNLTKSQAEFIRAKNLNLSAMVRDFIDSLIKDQDTD